MYDREPTVQVAAAMFQELCYANKDRLSAGLIIAGYDSQNGAEVYHIPSGGSLHKQEFSIGGSGSTYIYGYCDANFKEDMTREEAVSFVKNCIFPWLHGLMDSARFGNESGWE
jgi:20S proteasome subunit beta 1